MTSKTIARLVVSLIRFLSFREDLCGEGLEDNQGRSNSQDCRACLTSLLSHKEILLPLLPLTCLVISYLTCLECGG